LAGKQERQRKRARERYERQREERFQRRRKIQRWGGIGLAVLLVGGLVAGLTVAFAGGSPKSSAAAKPTATATPSASATPSTAVVTEPAHHCTYTKAGTAAKTVSLPPAAPDYKAAYQATVNTNRGKIEINLLNSKATCTVNSFIHLADAGFWNSSQCHRVSDSDGLYMLQCGDPTAKASEKLSCSSTTLGTGTPGYEFASENLTGATYKAGTVAMANSGTSDSNGSQFFLVFKNTDLPADYTPFGTITSGLDILQNVAKAGTSCTFPQAGGGVPKEKVIINSVTIKQV
jgi:peptidyl-prolyl cis-trans isomerase B (cyclophilin B)